MKFKNESKSANQHYMHGRAARNDNQGRQANPNSAVVLINKHWWLAGWHDRDMELSA